MTCDGKWPQNRCPGFIDYRFLIDGLRGCDAPRIITMISWICVPENVRGTRTGQRGGTPKVASVFVLGSTSDHSTLFNLKLKIIVPNTGMRISTTPRPTWNWNSTGRLVLTTSARRRPYCHLPVTPSTSNEGLINIAQAHIRCKYTSTHSHLQEKTASTKLP